ncbi:bifunctional 2-polyprenyl-6-hydroxyphenol methylase/3-demethylubiquinol 3-O-methyltransferase UbiG [Endozoicomonas sp. ONNA2]|uniref:class I SAM-dependent methyltransferase n=1 Tax=Endozoicomonas sp. ONNA2 TaxID=2828741 RepID=UPI0021487024|nr:class I SAM-dependent methyltransferase [Endozoicomonas sp. ONNA2]
MKPYMPVVADILNARKPKRILDAPSGSGWLRSMLRFEHCIDGIDLFDARPDGYGDFLCADLDEGIPENLGGGGYQAIVSCEGIEHIGNPLHFFSSARKHLSGDGLLIITTPNVWYPGAKLKYFGNGFFPSFPPLIGKIKRGTHMHITAWSFPQLHLFLTLAGYENIRLHDLPEERKPRHFYERVLAVPQRIYCRNKAKKASSAEERQFWQDAGSDQSTLGRRLVVSATSKQPCY